MKTLSAKLLSVAFALALLVTAASCKKEKARPYPLRGSWWDNAENSGKQRTLIFRGDSVLYQVYLKLTDVRPTTFRGTFTEQGNTLTMQFAPGNFNGFTVTLPEFRPPVNTSGFYTLFDGAMYKIEGSQLLINYTVYPAGQPQSAAATLRREIDAD